MDFFNGFSNSPRRGGFAAVLLAALFGAVVGGTLAAYTVLRYIGQDKAQLPANRTSGRKSPLRCATCPNTKIRRLSAPRNRFCLRLWEFPTKLKFMICFMAVQ